MLCVVVSHSVNTDMKIIYLLKVVLKLLRFLKVKDPCDIKRFQKILCLTYTGFKILTS
jgi:hypothetical protein